MHLDFSLARIVVAVNRKENLRGMKKVEKKDCVFGDIHCQ